MLNLGALAFASPWLLLGLAALPVLWWLLRVTPPAPKRVSFPALRLLLGLQPREETPAKTPLWLIILRMVLAGLIILALAHPLLNPTAQLAGKGPLVLAVDNGWSAARYWDERRNTLDDLVATADREGRNVVLLPTAPLPGAAAPPPLSIMRPNDTRAVVSELAPMPWPTDRDAALARLGALDLSGAELVWLSDGIDDGKALSFAQGLAKLGPLRVLTDDADALPRLITPAEGDDKDLTATVMRADATGPAELYVRALGDDGRLLARDKVTVEPGAIKAVAHLELPSELRNRATEIAIEGEASSGAVLLLDERWRRRPVGIVTARNSTPAQPLLNGAYYLEKALAPFSEVREGAVDNLLKGGIAVLALPDISPGGTRGEEPDRPMDGEWRHGAALCRTSSRRRDRRRSAAGDLAARRPHLGRRAVLGDAGRARALRRNQPVRRTRHPEGRHRVAPSARRADRRSRQQDLGAADRRHAARHRREARQGLADPGAHHRRSGMVDARHLRPLRQHAAPDRVAERRRLRQ